MDDLRAVGKKLAHEALVEATAQRRHADGTPLNKGQARFLVTCETFCPGITLHIAPLGPVESSEEPADG